MATGWIRTSLRRLCRTGLGKTQYVFVIDWLTPTKTHHLIKKADGNNLYDQTMIWSSDVDCGDGICWPDGMGIRHPVLRPPGRNALGG